MSYKEVWMVDSMLLRISLSPEIKVLMISAVALRTWWLLPLSSIKGLLSKYDVFLLNLFISMLIKYDKDYSSSAITNGNLTLYFSKLLKILSITLNFVSISTSLPPRPVLARYCFMNNSMLPFIPCRFLKTAYSNMLLSSLSSLMLTCLYWQSFKKYLIKL